MNWQKWGKTIFYVALLALLILIPFLITVPYYLGIVIVILLNILFATSIWLILQTGQVSIAHAAFASIGGYMAAALVMSYGFSFWLSLPLAMVIAVIVALIIGYITLRLKSHYFLIVTAAFGEIVRIVFGMIEQPFGGTIGILNLPPPDPIAIPGLPVIDFSSKFSFYYLTLLVAVIVVIIINRISKSRTGQAFHAIAQADLRAEHVGINTMRYKMLAFTLGSMFAALGGVLYAFNARCMLPYTFTFWQGIYFLIYVSVGGGTTIAGPILGAILFSILSQVLRPLQMLEPIVYGFALMMVMIFFKRGLMGALEKVWSSFRRRLVKVEQIE